MRSSPHPIGTPRGLLLTGPLASAAWLAAREIFPRDPKWSIEMAISAAGDSTTTLQLAIFEVEWGFSFQHAGKLSWIRITDVPFVHGRDEHQLLAATPPLSRIGELVRELEARYAIVLDREHPTIRSTIEGSEPVIARWIATL